MALIVAHCRPGFEPECAAELEAMAQAWDAELTTEIPELGGLVFGRGNVRALVDQIDLKLLVFTRQWFLALEEVELDPKNRVDGILKALGRSSGAKLFIESSDSEPGRELQGLCRAITAPLEQALKKAGMIREGSENRLHVLFLDGTHALVGYAPIARSHPEPMGIRRLRMPKDAPSRSTLKLEEALIEFVPRSEWTHRLRPRMHAVDLGACPGGWTYQMVQLGLRVTAVDHGQIDPRLMATGQVEHRALDGFLFKPERKVDWLLCDMVDKPMRVAQLLAKWLQNGWCREAIVNLKLPMKKRYDELERCLEVIEKPLLDNNREFELHAKQLYYDREEVTLHVRVLGVQ